MWRHICHVHVLVFVVIYLLASYGGKIEMHNAQKHSSSIAVAGYSLMLQLTVSNVVGRLAVGRAHPDRRRGHRGRRRRRRRGLVRFAQQLNSAVRHTHSPTRFQDQYWTQLIEFRNVLLGKLNKLLVERDHAVPS